jgi:hypothetical protein
VFLFVGIAIADHHLGTGFLGAFQAVAPPARSR